MVQTGRQYRALVRSGGPWGALGTAAGICPGNAGPPLGSASRQDYFRLVPEASPAIRELWAQARERLGRSLPEATFDLWIEPLRPVAIQDSDLILTAPAGVRAWVERRYAGLIAEALRAGGGEVTGVGFCAPGGGEKDAAANEEDVGLNPEYTFDRFVIGSGNRLAHAAALTVAEAPGESYNPLFLHGPSGLGKTHLLTAIANYLAASAPSLTVRYTTAESFTNEFVAALHASGVKAFKRRFRDLDVLLIDDVQSLEGKQHTEEEFFHTFNALYEGGSQIVLSADRMPSQLSSLAARLRDRFEWGLTVPIAAPDLPTRLTVLRRLTNEAGLETSDSALSELAERIDANIRLLRGALTRVIAHSSLLDRPLSSELIAEVVPGRQLRREVGPQEISDKVGESYGVSPEEITGPGRGAKVLRARQVAVYLTRELTDLSLGQIGDRFGGRDHSTVLNSVRRVQAEQEADPDLRRRLEELRGVLHTRESPKA